jgi:hypothetical protein
MDTEPPAVPPLPSVRVPAPPLGHSIKGSPEIVKLVAVDAFQIVPEVPVNTILPVPKFTVRALLFAVEKTFVV